jgi:hypothetical protein
VMICPTRAISVSLFIAPAVWSSCSFDAEMFAAKGAVYVHPSDDSGVRSAADLCLIR